jgi:hypothetical protein
VRKRDGRQISSESSAPAMTASLPSPAWRRVDSSRVIRPCLSIEAIWVFVPNARSADGG